MRGPRLLPMCGPVDQIMTSWPGCATGRRRSINWSIRVKMAVLAPMPRESDATATKVNSGLRRRLRRANRRSKRNLAMAYKVSTPQAQKSLQKEWDRRSVFVVFLVLDSPGGCLTGHKKRLPVLPAREIADRQILKPHIAFAAGVKLQGDPAIGRLGLRGGEIDHGDAVEDADHVIAFHLHEHVVPIRGPNHVLEFRGRPRDPAAVVAIQAADMVILGAVDFELHARGDIHRAGLEAGVKVDSAVAIVLALKAQGEPEILVVLLGHEVAVLPGHPLPVDGAVFHGPFLVADFGPAGEILAVEQRHPLFVGEQVGFVLGSLRQEDHRQREYYHQSSHHHWFYHKKRCRAEWKPDLFFAPPWKNSVICPNARG